MSLTRFQHEYADGARSVAGSAAADRIASMPSPHAPAVAQGVAHGPIVELDGLGVARRVSAGTPVFFEGDSADYQYLVVGGAVRLYKMLADGRRQITGFMLAGDYFGFGMPGEYGYGAEAITTTTLVRFARRDVERATESSPALQRRLLAIANEELRNAQDQMLLLGRKTAQEKVASFLIGLSARAERGSRTGNPVHIPMSRTDIADYLGLTMETVSRTITHFKCAGVIRLLDHGRILLSDVAALESLASGLLARAA